MLQLYFIRHAQSTNNAFMHGIRHEEYLNNRESDPDLTSIGMKQARLTADLLARPATDSVYDPQNRKGFGITHLYCSLMVRSIKTGMVISEKIGVPLVAWPEVHENGGVFKIEKRDDEIVYIGEPGPGRSFFTSEFPELVLPDDIPETGWWDREKESRENYRKRAQEIINRLIEVHGNNTDRVGIITHGGIFTMILSTLFDVQADHYWFLMNNCGISRVDFDDNGHVSLMYTNKVDFLPDDLVT